MAKTTRKIGLLHSGSKAKFVGAIAVLKAELPPDVEMVEKYAADLPGSVDDNLAYLGEGLVQDSKASGPDQLLALVAAGGPEPAVLLKKLTAQLNPKLAVVFTTVADPVKLGLAKTLKKPGMNMTGTNGHTSDLDPGRLEHLFEFVPDMKKGDKIGVLVAAMRPEKDTEFKRLSDKANEKNLKLVLRRRDVEDLQDIKNAFAVFKDEPVAGVIVTADALFNNLRKEVVACAAANGLPTIYQWKEFVDDGGLISHGPDILEAYRTAGEYITLVLGGKNPGDIACADASSPKTYINHKTAQSLGIPVPKTLLGFAVRPVG